MIILDQRSIGGETYGYCGCGRELKKGENNEVECPLCCQKLIWNEENVRMVSKGIRHIGWKQDVLYGGVPKGETEVQGKNERIES